MIIYKATSKTSGKSYVGQTRQSLKDRRQGHYDDRKRRSNAMGAAILKYGLDDFSWSIIGEFKTPEELNLAEVKYILEFNTLAPGGYNLTSGGEGGYVRSDETKAKISKKKTGVSVIHSATWKKGQRPNIPTEFKGKEIINLETGVFYESIREAAKAHNINHSTLAWRLRHRSTNQFAYIEAA